MIYVLYKGWKPYIRCVKSYYHPYVCHIVLIEALKTGGEVDSGKYDTITM